MDTLSYKTKSVNKENADKQWVLVDAEGMTVGRLASRVALILRGKHKPSFTPHSDCGDNVVVVNSEKINLSGSKWFTKEYIRHTGYPGGQRVATAEEVMAKDPNRIIENAVKGMLPKNKLSRALMKNLYVYQGAEHKQEAQKPSKIDLNTIR
ncbi:MAG: 50S ribosomal protein L13 [Crocinitomicaceae bacterium]|nr:50S ribosomal protein L13 [Crocinitomicaceae bacterium]